MDIEEEEAVEPLIKSTVSPEKQLTFRAVAVGVFIGSTLCFSNMYFGLQTGWITTGSLPAALLGFVVMRLSGARGFNPLENLTIQTTAVASATMPLAAGFVGILIPLMQMNDRQYSTLDLIVWCLSLCFIGVFIAVPMRKQMIVKEKLTFPTGTAAASMIKAMHQNSGMEQYQRASEYLLMSCVISSAASLFSYLIPILGNVPILIYLFGSGIGKAATRWGWTLRPSFSYVGQGMIMGVNTALSTGLGAIVGWAVLGPFANSRGWTPGPIFSYLDGAQGWILWVSLSMMTAEGIASAILSFLPYQPGEERSESQDDAVQQALDNADTADDIPPLLWKSGLVVSLLLCIGLNLSSSSLSLFQIAVFILISFFVTVIALRSMGKTDYNPVSGVGKIAQILFLAVRTKHGTGAIVLNLLIGAIVEGSATQSGDLLQDFKAGHLLGASPFVQFKAQLLGSIFSVFLSILAFNLYRRFYVIPGPTFPVPAASIWMDMATLLERGISYMAPHVLPFCIAAAVVGALLALVQWRMPRKAHLLPNAVAFAIGIYLPPSWSIPRVLGGLKNPASYSAFGTVVASGFVVGEGLFSIATAMMHGAGINSLTCLGCSEELIQLGASICTGCAS